MDGATCTRQARLWMSSYGARHLPDPSDTDLAIGPNGSGAEDDPTNVR